MQVILLKNVAKLGKKYDVKNVSDGYALNFLIPNGMAEPAVGGAIKRLEALKLKEEENRKVREDLLLKNLHSIDGIILEMEERANKQGHLFAGIHKEEIVSELKKQDRLEILPEHINLERPIKEVGEHEIEVKIQNETAKFKLIVKAKS